MHPADTKACKIDGGWGRLWNHDIFCFWQSGVVPSSDRIADLKIYWGQLVEAKSTKKTRLR
jgi:hypothetical protein